MRTTQRTQLGPKNKETLSPADLENPLVKQACFFDMYRVWHDVSMFLASDSTGIRVPPCCPILFGLVMEVASILPLSHVYIIQKHSFLEESGL